MADRFFIAPYDQGSGQKNNVRPWLIPDEAFEELTNAYVFRGRVRKRFGSRWLGDDPLKTRFRVNLGDTDGSGDITVTVPKDGPVLLVTPAVGQMFSIGDQVFTVATLGSPANLLISGTATLATFDSITGTVTITGAAPTTALYYYPSLPVMGLLTYDSSSTNDEEIIGFDTRFAYEYVDGWERLDGEILPGDALWSGDNSQFFWGTTWSGASAADKVFYVTNFNENEANFMRYYFGGFWSTFNPAIQNVPESPAAVYLNSARILVPFKNRLLAFNTWEGATGPGTNYQNRCRYSHIGDPLNVEAFRDDIKGRGNSIDAATSEAIITVEFVKDRLIVFFERSTWELVYTGNQAYPFVWQKINTELGAESTFSIVPFDKVCLGVGNVGIHACNGSNVERIDKDIPDAVFQIHNQDAGIERVYGIRDYYVEMVYWTFPALDASSTRPYPNRIMIYNYKTQTWAFNQDSITAFGYFQPVTGVTWSSTSVGWDDEVSWDSGSVQAKFRQVIAGNQEGYTFICDADETTNAAVLQITNLSVASNVVTVTCVDHNLRVGDFVYFEGITGTGNLSLINDKIFKVTDGSAQNSFTFTYEDALGSSLSGTYSGGGRIARVSNVIIKTKQYNFYADKGRNAYISKVDFMVDRTAEGRTQVDFFVSTSLEPLLLDASSTGSLLGSGTLDTFAYPTVPFEANATRVWHPVYFQADGEVVQLKINMNDDQMMDTDVREADFQLHAMVFHAQPTSSRLQ